MSIYHLKRLITISLIAGITACVSSSTLTGRWHDPQYSGAPIKKILVIAVVNKEVHRRALEEGYVEHLKKYGITGVASYSLVTDPKKAYKEKQLKDIVLKANVDAVLVSQLKAITTEKTEVPPRLDMMPTSHYAGGYYGYYNVSHQMVYQPGYTQVDKVVVLETKMFAVKNEKMIWSGSTKSFNPKTATKVIQEITTLILEDMGNSGLIGK